MKIISLQANNIKRLTAVHIEPSGNVVQITGKNANGKSSVLDSIMMALGGGDTIPGKPIRNGETKADIRIDLGDLVVYRTFTEKGTYLKVESADGAEYKSPQKILDKLIGKLSFDPLEFTRLKEKEQFNMLAEYAGIDLSEIDKAYKEKFASRTNINKRVTEKKAEIDAIELKPGNFPEQQMDPSDLIDRIQKAMQHNSDIDSAAELVDRSERKLGDIKAKVERLRNELQQAEDELANATTAMGDLRDSLAEKEKTRIDVEAMNDELRGVNAANEEIRKRDEYSRKQDELTDLKDLSESMTSELRAMEEDRASMILNAEMPIEGLGFGDGCVTYNGIPLSQASSAEQIRITVALAMAMNPKLRIIRVQDGSLLDSDSMKIIDEMAAEHDYQFWVERVDETGKVGIVIEDGHISSIDGIDYVAAETSKPEPVELKIEKPKAAKKPAAKEPDQEAEAAPEQPAKEETDPDPAETKVPVKKIQPQQF